jgi:hypothetical protein
MPNKNELVTLDWIAVAFRISERARLARSLSASSRNAAPGEFFSKNKNAWRSRALNSDASRSNSLVVF